MDSLLLWTARANHTPPARECRFPDRPFDQYPNPHINEESEHEEPARHSESRRRLRGPDARGGALTGRRQDRLREVEWHRLLLRDHGQGRAAAAAPWRTRLVRHVRAH